MSLNGLAIFADNLARLMETDAYRTANHRERLDLAARLINSRYGGGLFGFGRVRTLPNPEKESSDI